MRGEGWGGVAAEECRDEAESVGTVAGVEPPGPGTASPGRSLRSTTRTSGRTPPPTRSGSSRSAYFPERAFIQLSREGVAEPSRQTAPQRRARTTATSRAWYRGDSDCL